VFFFSFIFVGGLDRLILIPYRYQPEQVELIAREVLPRLGVAPGRPAPAG
jgi:hypothetical protein